MMIEIMWHRRKTRRITENTNVDLRFRSGEIPEGLPGSLAPGMGKEKRRELERSHQFLVETTGYADNEPQQGKPGNGSKPKPTSNHYQVRFANPMEGGRKTFGKSDWLIVLGDGTILLGAELDANAPVRVSHKDVANHCRSQGEGGSRVTQPAKET